MRFLLLFLFPLAAVAALQGDFRASLGTEGSGPGPRIERLAVVSDNLLYKIRPPKDWRHEADETSRKIIFTSPSGRSAVIIQFTTNSPGKLPSDDALRAQVRQAHPGASASELTVFATESGHGVFFDLAREFAPGLVQKIRHAFVAQPGGVVEFVLSASDDEFDKYRSLVMAMSQDFRGNPLPKNSLMYAGTATVEGPKNTNAIPAPRARPGRSFIADGQPGQQPAVVQPVENEQDTTAPSRLPLLVITVAILGMGSGVYWTKRIRRESPRPVCGEGTSCLPPERRRYKVTALRPVTIWANIESSKGEGAPGEAEEVMYEDRPAWIELQSGETLDKLAGVHGVHPACMPHEKRVYLPDTDEDFVPLSTWCEAELPKNFFGLFTLEVSK